MDKRHDRRIGYRALLTMAALVVVVAGLKAADTFFLPFLVAVFLSVLSAPPVLWLEQKRVPAWLAVLIVVLAVMGLLGVFGMLLATSVKDFADAQPRYEARLRDMTDATIEWVRSWGVLQSAGIEVSGKQIFSTLDPSAFLGAVGSTLTGLVSALTNTALVLLTLVFMLLEAAGFPRKMRVALNDPKADLTRYAKVAVEVQRYLAIKTMMSMGTGFLVWLWTLFLGIDFPMLWGLTAFLLNYIPNVGSVIAAVPAVLVALVQPDKGLEYAAGVGGGYIAINMVLGSVLEPQLMGKSLGLSPLVVFLSLVFWGWVWGPVGMLLSVPLTMMVKIMLEQSGDLRWVAVMLDAAPKMHGEPSAASSLIAKIRFPGRITGSAAVRGATETRATVKPPKKDDGFDDEPESSPSVEQLAAKPPIVDESSE